MLWEMGVFFAPGSKIKNSLADVSDNPFYFSARGEGTGGGVRGRRDQCFGSRGFFTPRRGGGLHKGNGPKGQEVGLRANWGFFLGGGLNFLFGSRNVHQDRSEKIRKSKMQTFLIF